MKILFSLIATSFLLNLSIAEDTEKIVVAYKLENQYRRIAETLSKSFNHSNCEPIEIYSGDIAVAARQARENYDTNSQWNATENREFRLGKQTEKALATTMALRDIKGQIHLGNVDSYKQALVGVAMWGPEHGVTGHLNSIHFQENEKLVYGEIPSSIDGTGDWTNRNGTFSINTANAGNVEINIDVEDYFSVTYLLKVGAFSPSQYTQPLWYLVPKEAPDANPYKEGFVDYPRECN